MTALAKAVAQANVELGTNAPALDLINRAMELLRRSPTPAQLEVLRLIEAGQKRDGHPPTIRELCELKGCRSTNAIAGHLKQLAKKGFVTSSPRKGRTLKITKQGRRWLTEAA